MEGIWKKQYLTHSELEVGVLQTFIGHKSVSVSL